MSSTWKVTFRAVKLAAKMEKVALFSEEPVLLAVSLYVMIVEALPAPCSVMKGFVAGIDTFSLQYKVIIHPSHCNTRIFPPKADSQPIPTQSNFSYTKISTTV